MELSIGQLVLHSYKQSVGVVVDIVPAEKKYRGGKITIFNEHKYELHYRVVWFGYEGTNLVSDFYIEAYDNGV